MSNKAEYMAAAKYFWAVAYQALTQRNFAAMRDFAKDAELCEHHGSPNGQLLEAIFGVNGKEYAPDQKVVNLGNKMPIDQVKAAKAAVIAEMNRHQQEVQKKKAANRPAAPVVSAIVEWHTVTDRAMVRHGGKIFFLYDHKHNPVRSERKDEMLGKTVKVFLQSVQATMLKNQE